MKASNSSIQAFKSCRRMYELKYIYGLEPVKQSDAIERGVSYHEALELVLSGEAYFWDEENPKVGAMVGAFLETVNIPVVAVEEWFEYDTPSGHKIFGRIDGRASNGYVVEHKTTSSSIDGAYFAKLEMDEQIPTYMIANKTNGVYYTVCQVPTIRQKKGETAEEFYDRCMYWFEDNKESKITCIEIIKSDEQLNKFLKEQDAILNEMENCKLFYRNPNHCMKYGVMCPYASVCMEYDPNKEYIQFKRRDNIYEKIGETKV